MDMDMDVRYLSIKISNVLSLALQNTTVLLKS